MHLPRLSAAFLLTACSAGIAQAGRFDFFSRPSNDVFVVTDVTHEGKTWTPPTKAKPVYCEAFNLGRDFGSIPGDKEPGSKEFVALIVKLLAEQGYQGNNATHPPTLTLAMQWGYLDASFGRNLAYLGGEKLDLMWEAQGNFMPFLDPRVLTRGMRSPTQQKVMDYANDSLYAVTISAFDYASVHGEGKPVLLWQTRIAAPTRGIYMADALPRAITVAAPEIGRESVQTVVAKIPPEGVVEFGELEMMGYEDEENPPSDPPPAK